MVARRAHNPEVAGSSPVSATNKSSLKRQVSTSFFLHYGKSGNNLVTLTPKRKNDCARTAEIFNRLGVFCGYILRSWQVNIGAVSVVSLP